MDRALFELHFRNMARRMWFEQNSYGHLYDIPHDKIFDEVVGVPLFSFDFPDFPESVELRFIKQGDVNITRSAYFLTNFARVYPMLEYGAVYAAYRFIEESFHLNETEIPLFKKLIAPHLNELVLEAYLGSWDQQKAMESRTISAIAGIRYEDDLKALARDFFGENFMRLRTRIVGFRYRKDSFIDLDGSITLTRGQDVYLHRDYGNPHDNYAVAVLAGNGKMIGYIRRTIAWHLAYRMDQGDIFRARIAVILNDTFRDDEKIYIEITKLS